MIRNLKALGLAVVAVLALGALGASGASAATDHFTADDDTALLTGVSHDNVFQLNANNKFECTTAKFAATIIDGATQATVDVEYSGTKNVTPHTSHCTSSSGTVTVDMNGCDYVLSGETTQSDNGADGPVWIVCEGSKQIQITSSILGVTISIPSQTPTTGGVSYENVANHEGGEKSGVKVNATATGITSTCAPALACFFGGIPTHSNAATYTGSVSVTGYEDKNDSGVITPANEGSKINVGVETTQ